MPNRRMCRSAGIPDVSAVGRCGDRKPLPSYGSGSCLMLSTIEFALTPHRWGLSRERHPHGHVTVSPVPRRSPASRPGRGSGARGTFHDSHGRRESNPQPPVLETGALPVELRPFAAVVELCAPAGLARPRELRPEMQKGRSVRLRVLVLVTRGLPPQLERPGMYRCLTAPTWATPAGSAATDPWSRSRARSLRSSTATGQHPAHGPHCDSRRRG